MSSSDRTTRTRMTSTNRMPIFPSRRSRLKTAQIGHRLLKTKADALQVKSGLILTKIIEMKTLMAEVMKEAAFSLAEAKFDKGNFNQQIIQNVSRAQLKVRTKKDNVAEIRFPIFEAYQEGGDSYELTGLARGGQQLAKLKANNQKTISLLVELASLQTLFVTLDEAVHNTNRRVHAIELDIVDIRSLPDVVPSPYSCSYDERLGVEHVGRMLRTIGDDFNDDCQQRKRSNSFSFMRFWLQGVRRNSS